MCGTTAISSNIGSRHVPPEKIKLLKHKHINALIKMNCKFTIHVIKSLIINLNYLLCILKKLQDIVKLTVEICLDTPLLKIHECKFVYDKQHK